MVTKKKAPSSSKKRNLVVSEVDRLKLQLFNAVVDRAAMALENSQIRMENSRLGVVIAQRDLDASNSELQEWGQELSQKYSFSMTADSVDWTTGQITRSGTDDDGK